MRLYGPMVVARLSFGALARLAREKVALQASTRTSTYDPRPVLITNVYCRVGLVTNTSLLSIMTVDRAFLGEYLYYVSLPIFPLKRCTDDPCEDTVDTSPDTTILSTMAHYARATCGHDAMRP